MPAFESDSDFDLTPSSEPIDALQPDSGSDFELSALDGSDEFEATPLAGPSDSDVTAADPGFSGINLSRPSDSGINLQMASGLGLGRGRLDRAGPAERLEHQADRRRAGKPKPSLAKTPPPPHASPPAAKAEKDIFDDTDFEVDALDSDSDSDDRTMQLEAHSDFELEEADTGSEVFAIDEEDVDQNAATALGPAGRLGRRRGRGGRRLRRRRLGRDGQRLGRRERGRRGRRRPPAARSAPSPVLASAAPRPSGAASGSACSASRPSSCSS